jgi:hypothetical protein
MFLQQLPHCRREPARVAELKAVAGAGQPRQRVGKQVVVAVKVLRQLPEDRAQPSAAAQRLERLPEAGDRVGNPAQPLHVGQVAARLDREEEVAGDLFDPGTDRRFLRQAVEGRVDLDRVEDLGVAFQPAPLRQAVGI